MLGEHIKRYCEIVKTYRLMVHTIPERAERLRRTGVMNPMPSLEREAKVELEKIKLERMDIEVCLKSLDMPGLPETFNNVNEFLKI